MTEERKTIKVTSPHDKADKIAEIVDLQNGKRPEGFVGLERIAPKRPKLKEGN
jgi:hypothetical protein